jgi:glutamyl-tRNA synthetase
MILGADGKRLSKRHGAVNVMSFREGGYLPEALLNYLVRLGWSHGDQELFSLDEMMQLFNLAHVSRSACAFDYDKLRWLNQHYLKTLSPEQSVKEWMWQMRNRHLNPDQGPAWPDLWALQATRFKTMDELVAESQYFYQDIELDASLLLPLRNAEVDAAMQSLIQALDALANWTAAEIMATIKQVANEHALKIPALGQPMRILLTGTPSSPSIDATCALLGKKRVLERLARY